MLLLAALSACSDAPVVPVDAGPGSGWRHPLADALRAGLPGFEVREGRVQPFPGCGSVIDDVGHCLGNNSATPYMSIFFEEDGYDTPFGALHLDADEAVVFVGLTPPESRYFSLQAAVHERLYDDGWRTPVGSIARSLNLLRIQHAGSEPFGQRTTLVATGRPSTADALAGRIRPFLASAGEPDVLDVIELPMLTGPSYDALVEASGADGHVLLRTGYSDDADRFSFTWRIAGADPDDAWFDPERIPAAVFKVRPTVPQPLTEWEWPELPPPRDPSRAPAPTVAASLLLVAQAVVAEAEADGRVAARARFDPADFEGFRCVERGLSCGNSDDAWYSASPGVLLPSHVPGGGATVIGVVHSALPELTGEGPRLAYDNLDILDSSIRASFGGWFDTDLLGSARERFPNGVPGVPDAHLDAFFALEVARTCDRPACIELAVEALPEAHGFNFLERAYLDLDSGTGPHPAAVLPSHIVAYGPAVEWRPALGRLDILPTAP
ncbi:MAG: hypothetical protein R3F61_02700 [Myxococcota bacterium]